jgi:hypothetical protein
MVQKELWYDIRLRQEEMNFLHNAISEENKENVSKNLAGNIFKSETIKDKDNWFYETVLKELSEKMFYRDHGNYGDRLQPCSRVASEARQRRPLPKFELYNFWVNYMKQYEFNPIHGHGGLYSFAIFVKIPTHWKEQHALPISSNSAAPIASDFAFIRSEKNSETCLPINFPLSSEDEGRMLFFPAWLQHQVYPFYGTEEERITISGNISQQQHNTIQKNR